MNLKIYFIAIAFLTSKGMNAQQFLNKAVVEYEMKANIKKTMGNGVFDEMLKDKLPTFKTGFYRLTFSDNKSIYKFDHWEANLQLPDFLKKNDEENTWYYDYNSGKLNMQKNVYGSNLVIEDSIRNLNWKLTTESREIAGFNCRKAVAVIFDSVYVFAFYTDEILLPGGPFSINGLPGLILGVTIPRLYTSWIATKVLVNGVNEQALKPVSSKKTFTTKSLKAFIDERTKDWYSDDEEEKQQKDRFIWSLLL